MTSPELSIKRPVMACMLTLLVILFGVIAYTRVGIQETPNITYPVITVKTALPGGDPKLISQTINKPAEKVLNTVSGLYQLSSSSTQGM